MDALWNDKSGRGSGVRKRFMLHGGRGADMETVDGKK